MSAAPKLETSAYARLKITAGPHQGQDITLSHSPFTLGRGSDNDLALDNDKKVSRQHLQIRFENNKVSVKNVSEKNFLLVNGLRVDEGDVEESTTLQIGETTIELIPQGSVPSVESKMSVLQPLPKATPLPTPVYPSHLGNVTPPAPPSIPRPQSVGAYNPQPMGMGAPSHQTFKTPKVKPPPGKSKSFFYIILVALVAGGFFLFSGKKKESVDRGGFRKNTDVEQDLLSAQNAIKEFEARKERLDNKAYQRAQENYIKGFRDFRQGNYARARDHFQLVLNLDPSNPLAQRYYNLSKIKFDELVQFNMIQGLSYREKKNYRLCRSSFQNVLVMINNNPQHPKYKEANDFFKECNLGLEGRY